MPHSLIACSKVAAHDARVRRAHCCVGRPSITLAPRINQRGARRRSATHIAHCQPGQTLESIATVPKGQPFTVMGGDIGGTNARLCFWSVNHEGHVRELARQVYQTCGHGSLEECVADFCQLKEVQQDPPSAAAFALAGPVEEKLEGGRRCRMTNLGWDVHASSLAETLATALPENRCRGRVQILNDFEAIGYGIPVLGASDLDTLHAGEPLPKGPKAVLGPGTGVGEAQLFYNRFVGTYSVEPSEGSHADFPPRGEQQRRLASFAEQELGTSCEIEQVVAGFGLERIYRFALSESGSDAPADLEAAQISAAAIDGEADAVEAMRLFMAIIGAEAGHMALRTLARGGVYLAGGILPKVADGVRDKPELNLKLRGALMQGYLNEGSRFCDKVVRKCPFYLVMNSNVGLLGSQQYAIREVEQLL